MTTAFDKMQVERIEMVGDFYFRSVALPFAGMRIPQHTHDHDHATFVGSGRVRGWRDGECLGEKSRGEAFYIQAGHAHWFEALEDQTLLTCVHSIASAMSIQRKGL